MDLFRSYRIVDGKPRWVIVNENGKIINKNPNKEELKVLIIEYTHGNTRKEKYNNTNMCEFFESNEIRCEEKLYPHNARQFNINGKIVWYCEKHGGRYRSTLPNGQNDTRKSIADSRTGNLDVNSPSGKGRISEQITCKVYGIKNLNIEYDNFHTPIDHSRDQKLGIIQSKGRIFNSIEGYWSSHVENEHNKEFDYLIFYCMSKDVKYIDMVYIFPRYEIIKRSSITIYKDPLKGALYKGFRWYDKYRVDEKPYNDAYHSLNKYDLEGIRP